MYVGISIENIIPPQVSYCIYVVVVFYFPYFSGKKFLSGVLEVLVASWKEKSIYMEVRSNSRPSVLD